MKPMQIVAACLLFVASALFGAAAFADPPGRVGRLSYLAGPVSFAPAGLDEWSAAIINRPITIGDHLWTDDGARAEVHIGSTAVRLAPRTNLDVLNLDDRFTQLRVAQGTLNLRVRHLVSDGQFEIDTPTTAVTVREPGSYRIDVDPDGSRTTVSVRSGELNVTGANANFLLYENESVTLYSDSPNYQLEGLPRLDSFDRFSFDRDRREDNVRSARYVPYDMTGYEDLDAYGSWSTAEGYGTVWFPSRISASWAPYRYGRWMWVEPWGWTWVDEEPWGFAPFHYGRWIHFRGRWCWYPGAAHDHPVYAPALVAFVGGGPVVGWFPLGFREAYIPWYAASPTYVREVNVAHVSNVPHITTVTNITNINYANRSVPSAVTAVSGAAFAQGRPVRQAVLAPAAVQQLARAPVVGGGAPVAPAQQSLIGKPVRTRPPEAVLKRAVVAVSAPPPRPAAFALRQAEIAKEPNKPFQVKPLRAAAAGPSAPTGATPAPGGGKGAATTSAQLPVRVIQPPKQQTAPRAGERRMTPAPGQLAKPPSAPPLPTPSSGREEMKSPPPSLPPTPPRGREETKAPPPSPPPAPPRGREEMKAPPPSPPSAPPRGREEMKAPPPSPPPSPPSPPPAPPRGREEMKAPPLSPPPAPPRGREETKAPPPSPPPAPPRGREETKVPPASPPPAPPRGREETKAPPPPAPQAAPAPPPHAAPVPAPAPQPESKPPERGKPVEQEKGKDKHEENRG